NERHGSDNDGLPIARVRVVCMLFREALKVLRHRGWTPGRMRVGYQVEDAGVGPSPVQQLIKCLNKMYAIGGERHEAKAGVGDEARDRVPSRTPPISCGSGFGPA